MHLYSLISFYQASSLLTSHCGLALPGLSLSGGLISQKTWKTPSWVCRVAQVVYVELTGQNSDMSVCCRWNFVNRQTPQKTSVSLLIHSLQALSAHLHCSLILSSHALLLLLAYLLDSLLHFHNSSQCCPVKAHCPVQSVFHRLAVQTAHSPYLIIAVWPFATHLAVQKPRANAVPARSAK